LSVLAGSALVTSGLTAMPTAVASAARHSAATTVASPAASKLPPSKDPFYRYTGKRPLRKIKPGTVLKHRSVAVSLGTNATPIPATQLLYRTTDEQHHPSITVTTVISPTTAVGVPRVVAYLSFYDALGAECDPSYTLTGGNAGSANEQQAEEEEAIAATYLSEGDTLEIPDFENEKLHWAAGQESGYSTLDSVRATESALHLTATTTPVALTGYSGGSIAGEWASELAPRYAPNLHIVGVAEGGIPVDFAHNLKYVNKSKVWSGVIPAVLVSSSRAFGVKLPRYLSAKGRRITHQVSHECIGSFNGAYPGLSIQSLLKKRYRNFLRQPVFARIVNHLIMGRAPGHPQEPLYMVVGDEDGTGDGVMVTKDVQALAHEYCKQGVSVQFTAEKGDSHTAAAIPFEENALSFVQERLDGQSSTPQSCSAIGKGNSLRPIAIHRRHHH
jgi:hypothetical protein